jgi:hypothetical protein
MSKPIISLDKINFKAEMERVERELLEIAEADIEGRIDFAVDTLQVVTPVDTGEARRGWKSLKVFRRGRELVDGFIKNDVEHITALNNGHSKQAPKYFIEQVLSKIGLITPN